MIYLLLTRPRMKTVADCDKEIRSIEAQPYVLRESLKDRGLYAFLQNLSQTDFLSEKWLKRCPSTEGGPVGSLIREISHAVWSGQKEKEKKKTKNFSWSHWHRRQMVKVCSRKSFCNGAS